MADTTVAVTHNIKDTKLLKCHPLDTVNAISADITTNIAENDKDEISSKRIVKKYPLLKIILMPNKNTYTGLATIINTIPFVSLFASTITLLLLLIGLLSKLIDKKAIKIFLILEICAATFLFIASPYMIFDYEILWVYWMCMVCIIVLILIDAYILYKQKRKEK